MKKWPQRLGSGRGACNCSGQSLGVTTRKPTLAKEDADGRRDPSRGQHAERERLRSGKPQPAGTKTIRPCASPSDLVESNLPHQGLVAGILADPVETRMDAQEHEPRRAFLNRNI